MFWQPFQKKGGCVIRSNIYERVCLKEIILNNVPSLARPRRLASSPAPPEPREFACLNVSDLWKIKNTPHTSLSLSRALFASKQWSFNSDAVAPRVVVFCVFFLSSSFSVSRERRRRTTSRKRFEFYKTRNHLGRRVYPRTNSLRCPGTSLF